jgi:hypothetical protein
MEDIVDAPIPRDRATEPAVWPPCGVCLTALGAAVNLAWIGFLLWFVLRLL